MADQYLSLVPHAVYKALPEQAVAIKPDSGCLTCNLAQADNHKTCDTFKLKNAPAVLNSQRLNLKRMRQIQGALHLRAFDSDGIVGSFGDQWYFENAAKAINFTYFSSWNLTAVSGDTVTLEKLGGGDARQLLHATWYGSDKSGYGFKVTGYEDFTCVQALDMLELQSPSAAARLKCKILQVISGSATTYVLKLDKSLTGVAFQTILDAGQTAPTFPAVKVYHYGREAEAWRFILEPYYFLGRRTQKTIELADVPADGIWTLESAVICPPQETATLQPVFVLEGWNVDAWVTINEATARLHIKPDMSSYALKTTLPSGSFRGVPASDLTAIYTRFRATYYKETTAADTNCQLVGYDRCFHSRVDPNDSAGNHGALKGAGITADGDHVYCSQRVYSEFEPVDEINRFANPPGPGQDGITDRVITTAHHPTGLDLFPMDTGKCILYGYCNKHVNSLDRIGDREAPFSRDYMTWLLELWFACDKTNRQKYINAFGPGGFTTGRVLHPSIMWLNDYYAGLISPHGFNVKDVPRGQGTWFVVKPDTVTDAGNENLRNVSGFERGYAYTFDPVTFEVIVDTSRRGNLPATMAGYTTMRDPFTPGAAVETDILEYIGARVERDSLQITDSRGLGNISMALTAEDIIAPNFDVSVTDLQRSTRATFLRPLDGDAVVTILPYRQDAKPERVIGSRVVKLATPLGGHRWLIEFENTTHTFSRFDAGTESYGDSYNKIFTVQAGGGPCILPFEHQALNSFDGEKETGSRAAGAMPLDCIEFADGNRFVIEYVMPHGGGEADTWGNRTLINKGGIGGFYDCPVAVAANGDPLSPIVITSVKRLSDNKIFAVVDEDVRPVLLVNQTWFDGNKRLFFTTLNAGQQVEIKYTDSVGTLSTQYYTIVPSFTVAVTGTKYTEWTGATTKTVYIGATAATIVTGGAANPAAGSVRVNRVPDTAAGDIRLTFNINDAPKVWRMVLEFNVEAPDPQNDWAAGGKYLAFAKKRDVAVVRADALSGGTDWFTGNVAVGESVSFIQSGTVLLPRLDAPQVVEWTVQGTDNWAAIPAAQVTVNAASGAVIVAAAFFTANFQAGTGAVCFRFPGIQMIDNRGQVPASVMNKTEAVIDAMNWVQTRMSGGRGDSVSMAANLYKVLLEDGTTTTPVYNYFPNSNPYNTNGMSGGWTSPGMPPWSGSEGLARIGFSTAPLGPPQEIFNFADGVEILEAYAVVSVTNTATSSYTAVLTPSEIYPGYFDWIGTTVPGTANDGFIVLAGSGTGTSITWTPVGTISGGGIAGKSKVVNVTDIMQFMFTNRKGSYHSYCIVPAGAPVTGADMQGLLEGLMGTVPTTGQKDMDGDGYIMPVGGDNSEEFVVLSGVQESSISWGSISIGVVAIRINHNGTDKLIEPHPRLPAMIDLPE